MSFIINVFLLLVSFNKASALCNTCSLITGIACVAADQFSICVNGLPSAIVSQCPNGTVCTANALVCSSESTAEPSCSRCGTCNANNTFACMGYNTFSLCYGTTVPDSTIYTCSGTLACFMDDPQICIDPTVAGIGGTCTSITTTTSTSTTSSSTTSTSTSTSTSTESTTATTPNPATEPQAYCASVASVGRYDLTVDTSCKKYIYCALLNNTWIGKLFECPGSTYFNATTRICGANVPSRCATV